MSPSGRIRTDRESNVYLALGSLVNGLAAYAFIVLGTRVLGVEEFAAVSIVWTIWAFAIAVVTFPLQHWIIRTVEVSGGETAIRGALTPLVLALTGISIMTFLLTLMVRDGLFRDDGIALPLLCAVIVAESGVVGIARGLTASREQYRRAALIVAGENVIRVITGAMILVMAPSSIGYSAALLAGVFVLVLFPSSLRFHRTGTQEAGSPLGSLTGIAGGTLVAQVILTGPPLLLATLGASEQMITAMFATGAVLRAPYLIGLGLALRAMRELSAIATADPERLRSLSHRIVTASLAGAAVGGVVAAMVGPSLIEAVFGLGSALEPASTGLLAAGSVLALGGLALTLVVIAEGTTSLISIAWIAAAIAGGLALYLPLRPTVSVALAFLIAESVAVVVLGVAASLKLRASDPAKK